MKKLKVRIAVAVDPTGDWNACAGSWAKDDATAMGICVDTLAPGEQRFWVDAEIEVPEEGYPVVAGAVSADNEGTDA